MACWKPGKLRDADPALNDPQLSFQLAQAVQDLDFLSALLRNRSEPQRLKQLTDYLARQTPTAARELRACETGAAERPQHVALRNVRVMFGAARTAPLTRPVPGPCRWFSRFVAHAGVLSLVVLGPRSHLAERPRSLYEQVIKPHEHELVWYSFRQKLPDVSPLGNRSAQPPAAELKTAARPSSRTPSRANSGRQMIWRPLPQIKPQPEIASPNILAFRCR